MNLRLTKFPIWGNLSKLFLDRSSLIRFEHLHKDDISRVNGVCKIKSFNEVGFYTSFYKSTVFFNVLILYSFIQILLYNKIIRFKLNSILLVY